jgi:hypothetical protein
MRARACLGLVVLTSMLRGSTAQNATATSLLSSNRRVVVTQQAMGARCAVAADFDGDGRADLVSASSNDNAVSWFKNMGVNPSTGLVSFSIKKQITWSSLGSRIVTTGE